MSRSKVKGQDHQGQDALCTPITPNSERMEHACCKYRHAAADGTIPSLPGVISAACVRFVFRKTSSVLLLSPLVSEF